MRKLLKGLALPVALIALGAPIGNLNAPAHAQMGPSAQSRRDAALEEFLKHELPK